MKIISNIILNLQGWKVVSEFPNIDKSVIIFAPHTSYWDGFFGKLFLMQFDVNYKFLSKKELFKFPLNIFFKLYGSIPVSENKEYINEITKLFENNEKLHIVLSPEGQLLRTNHWKKGFYYMASRANVPIIVSYVDYKKKEMGIKGVITETSDLKKTMIAIGNMYKDINAKYPKYFALDKRYS